MPASVFQAPEDFKPLSLELTEKSIPILFERAVEMHPSHIALRQHGHGITYRQLNDLVNTLAHAILSQHGEGEEPVIFLHGHDVKAIVSLLAILKTGRPYLPLNPAFPAEFIHQIVADSGSPLFLTDAGNLSFVDQVLAANARMNVLNVDDLVSSAQHGNPGIRISPDAPACILYTSGSTGEPKGIVNSHRYIAFSTVTDINLYYLNPRDRMTLLNTISFSGSRTSIFGALVSGATLCLYDIRSDGAEGAAQWMLSEQITHYRSIAPIFRLVFSNIPAGVVIPSLCSVGVGGDTVRPSDVALFRSHTLPHCFFRNGLASTECGILTEYFLAHNTPVPDDVVPVGYPADGKQVMVVDENGDPLPNGEQGEIIVRSRYLASGYWRKPELTAEKFIRDPDDPQMQTFYSGDSGRFNSEGALEHLGRLDNQVKVRGNRVVISEVERVLNTLPEVREAVIVAWPSRIQLGEKQLAAYIILRDQARLTGSDVRSMLADKLPDYMLPTFIVFLDAFPYNVNGKVDRRALPEPARRTGDPLRDAPANATEEKLLAMWRKLFRLDTIGVNENFFELGGDSLLAVRLFMEIESAFKKAYPANVLLRHGTIRQLAELIEKTSDVESPGFLIPLRTAGARPPLFLIPGARSDVLTLIGLVELLGADQPVYGLQDFYSGHSESLYVQGVVRAAGEFVNAIKTVQPRGPYRIAGYSFGGVIAFEMARQLSKDGEVVSYLGIIDTTPPVRIKRKVSWQDRYRLHTTNLSGRGLRENLDYLSTRFKRLLRRLADFRLVRMFYRTKAADKILGRDHLRIVKSALVEYSPTPHDGTAVVYRAAKRPLTIRWDVTEPWKQLVKGDLFFRDVPGEHVSLIKRPYVETLAGMLKEDLDRVG